MLYTCTPCMCTAMTSMCCRSTAPGGRSVQIRSGRPDVAAQLADLPPGHADATFLGVWTAGPKLFNTAVYTDAHKSGKRVDVTQMAFEL